MTKAEFVRRRAAGLVVTVLVVVAGNSAFAQPFDEFGDALRAIERHGYNNATRGLWGPIDAQFLPGIMLRGTEAGVVEIGGRFAITQGTLASLDIPSVGALVAHVHPAHMADFFPMPLDRMFGLANIVPANQQQSVLRFAGEQFLPSRADLLGTLREGGSAHILVLSDGIRETRGGFEIVRLGTPGAGQMSWAMLERGVHGEQFYVELVPLRNRRPIGGSVFAVVSEAGGPPTQYAQLGHVRAGTPGVSLIRAENVPASLRRPGLVSPRFVAPAVPREVLADAGLIRNRAWWNPARYRIINNPVTRTVGRAAGVAARGAAVVKAAQTIDTMEAGAEAIIYTARVNADRNRMLNALAQPGGFDGVDVDAHLKTRFAAGMQRAAARLESGVEGGPTLLDLVLPFIP
jgi:hypothetical protein